MADEVLSLYDERLLPPGARVCYVSYVVGDETLWVGARAMAVRSGVVGFRPLSALPMTLAQATFCALRLARFYRTEGSIVAYGRAVTVYRYRPGADTLEASPS